MIRSRQRIHSARSLVTMRAKSHLIAAPLMTISAEHARELLALRVRIANFFADHSRMSFRLRVLSASAAELPGIGSVWQSTLTTVKFSFHSEGPPVGLLIMCAAFRPSAS